MGEARHQRLRAGCNRRMDCERSMSPRGGESGITRPYGPRPFGAALAGVIPLSHHGGKSTDTLRAPNVRQPNGGESGIDSDHPGPRPSGALRASNSAVLPNCRTRLSYVRGFESPRCSISGAGRDRIVIGAELWRREWDSNPRTPVKMLLEFQSSAFDRSAISPNQSLTSIFSAASEVDGSLVPLRVNPQINGGES